MHGYNIIRTQSHAPFVPDEDVARFLELSVFFDLACTANAGCSVLNQIGCGEKGGMKERGRCEVVVLLTPGSFSLEESFL